MSTKVKLRKKQISNGRYSLYLDFYPAIANSKTGELTRREFLGMYLHIDSDDIRKKIKELKGKGPTLELTSLSKSLKKLTPDEKLHNNETFKLAEQIRQKQENQLNKPEIYSGYEKEQLRKKALGEQDFVTYFKGLAEKRKDSTYATWLSANKYLESFTGGNIKIAAITEKWCNDFKEYLLTTTNTKSDQPKLSRNSAASYFNKVKAALKQAYKDGILQTDLNSRIESITEREIRRNYLTLEELNALIKTECLNPLLKRAALFSALTGLRHSDIKALTWGDVENIQGEGYVIKFTQQKTKGVETHPISDQAYSLLGTPGDPQAKIFEGLDYSAYQNKFLYQWIGAAGITKNITFHCFRHTFATLQLFNGTDIYTVSKMLGHKDLKTTQVYAKVVDEAKRKASDKIKLDF